jgi:5-methylcytosine-specific restriction protein A
MVARKKAAALEATGRLACEACGFDFRERYGERGEGFIECHHLSAVSTLRPGQRTRLSELALVCSNCHRMIHRRTPWLALDELRALVSVQSV